jgi:hypothetical protein
MHKNQAAVCQSPPSGTGEIQSQPCNSICGQGEKAGEARIYGRLNLFGRASWTTGVSPKLCS